MSGKSRRMTETPLQRACDVRVGILTCSARRRNRSQAIATLIAAILWTTSLVPGSVWSSNAAGAALSPRQSQARSQSPAADPPLRLAIAGLVHGHVHGFMRQLSRRQNVELVGVYEPDATLREQFRVQHKLDASRMFADLDALFAAAKPDFVAGFSNTRDHRGLVEVAARRGVHVMVEKPLAVSVADARAIEQAAAKGRIHVIVNYETTWYASHRSIWETMHERRAGGALRKIVAMDGHEGPKEINVQPEFLDWLRDPIRNGAGALFDFGCYGANLATWLMDEARPLAVTAMTQRFKPAIYPNVDDEATILIEYPGAQAIAQASWNWPFSRKDLEVYGERAYAIATGPGSVRVRLPGQAETSETPALWPEDERDVLSYLTAVVRGRIKPSGLSGLRNNVIVVEILEAARESARTGKSVRLAR
jgi:predicted dehydrogenase